MKGHEHKYIEGLIGDVCDFCGLSRNIIEETENNSRDLLSRGERGIRDEKSVTSEEFEHFGMALPATNKRNYGVARDQLEIMGEKITGKPFKIY